MGDISTHFNRSEFACHCNCGFDTVDAELLHKLEIIRTHFDSPIQINSGCRCPDYNAKIGGKPDSQHTKGRAADIVVNGCSPTEVANYLEYLLGSDCGMGRYKDFTHIDTRTGFARWEG